MQSGHTDIHIRAPTNSLYISYTASRVRIIEQQQHKQQQQRKQQQRKHEA